MTDWLFGAGATRAEKALVLATVAAAGAVLIGGHTGTWAWWQTALVAVLAVDLVGGVVANGLDAAKRFYHADPPARPGRLARLALDPAAFAAGHVHPFVLAWAFPSVGWGWAAAWYLACLAGALLVSRTPRYLARPTALGVTVVALLAGPGAGELSWVGPVLVLKLVLAHAVPEVPQRRKVVLA